MFRPLDLQKTPWKDLGLTLWPLAGKQRRGAAWRLGRPAPAAPVAGGVGDVGEKGEGIEAHRWVPGIGVGAA